MTQKPELSFDGKGINGPDEYRSRVATFANDDAAKKYGPLFEAAPDLLEALQLGLDDVTQGGIAEQLSENPEFFTWVKKARAAITKARGKAG